MLRGDLLPSRWELIRYQCCVSRNLNDYMAVMSFIQLWQYFTKGALAASNSELACLTNCAASAVPLTHCGDEAGVQIAEQLTVLCDLMQLCLGRFIRWGLSLPRRSVMNCRSLRSRWSQTDDGGSPSTQRRSHCNLVRKKSIRWARTGSQFTVCVSSAAA